MRGVRLAGLRTMAFPAMSPMQISPKGIEKGKFHGEMQRSTPRGR